MTREHEEEVDRAFEEGQNSMMRSLREARRERDEAREQARALTEQLAEAKLAGDLEHEGRMAAQEQVRSLTVERDAARADHRLAVLAHADTAKAADALRARLSRAREALGDLLTAMPTHGARVQEAMAQEACAALRAALSEPPAG